MPFEAYLTAAFQHPHEAEMFGSLVDELTARFAAKDDLYVLIGNVLFEGSDIDAVLLSPQVVCILEMKAHGGKVSFMENVPWKVGTARVMGGSKKNPYQQVRAYRFSLKNFLRNRSPEFLSNNREVMWNHVAGLVVFGGEIDFDDHVLGGLRSWFGITDLGHVGGIMAQLRSDGLRLESIEIRSLLQLIGIDRQYLYTDLANAPVASPLEASPARPIKRRQLVYLKELGFRDHEARVRNRGGASSAAAQRVHQLFHQIRQGVDALSTLPTRHDDRVSGAAIYTINLTCELVVINHEVGAFPAFLGTSAEVNAWLEVHVGLAIVVNTATGRIQLTTVSAAAEIENMPAQAVTTDTRPLLAQLDGLELDSLIPQRKIREQLLLLDETSPEQEILETVEMVSDQDLRDFLYDLAVLVRSGNHVGAQARLGLRLGIAIPLDDAGRFAQDAASSTANSDQTLIINDLSPQDLDRLLDPSNFEEWMLFLHPDQQALVEAEYDRPLVLTGVSGSGKTCVLVHRARHLARKYPTEKIGVLTLSRTLAGLLQNLVNRLLTEEERRNVFVRAFYDVFRDCLRQIGPDKYFLQLENQIGVPQELRRELDRARERWPNRMVWNVDPISKEKVEDQWADFYMSRNPDLLRSMDGIEKYLVEANIDAERYLEEEFALIRSQFTVPARNGYLDTDDVKIRAGRAIQFRREMREQVLRLLLYWDEWLIAGGMIDDLGLTQALMPLHTEMQELPDELKFRCLLVDEFQDFSTLDLQLFRRIVPLTKPDSLFLAGDTVQKILVKRQSLKDAGLDRGPAIHKAIRKNYRNSKQVLLAASRLANHYGGIAQAQEEEVEVLDPELAQRDTNPPIVIKTDNQITKAWEIALECTENTETEPWTVCIATAAPQRISISDILAERPLNLAACVLSGDCILRPEETVVGTISDLKGFEFRLVLIVGCDAGSFPQTGVPRAEVWRDALRLYVAMTRGRDQVYLLHGESASEFMTVFGDTVILRSEPILRQYERAVPLHTLPLGNVRPRPTSRVEFDWDANAEAWFREEEIEALRRYFAKYVYRDNLTFHEWMKPRALQHLDFEPFRQLRNVSRRTISNIFKILRAKNVITGEPPNGVHGGRRG